MIQHIPVLKSQVLEYLAPKPCGLYLDGTVGLGGHAQALLAKEPTLELIGLDRDLEALEQAKTRLNLYTPRVKLFHANFSDFSSFLSPGQLLDGALLDLGVSSLQLDKVDRGFSFKTKARLDMRMDQQSGGPSCYELINSLSEEKLREILIKGSEDPLACKIARAIIEARAIHPLETTWDLAQIVIKVYPKSWLKKSRHHPATRTFQALRLYINDELGALERFLQEILAWLKVGGRLVFLTFHSLEDRLVKQFMQEKAKGCICPSYVSKCSCGHVPEVKILTKKPLVADLEELSLNPRASSAKLRCCEKIA
ncbi:MAG: 16S rRNA (cytosine(1402)-N(4))-methyltransferase RsmH [Desulfovibrionaceae bacterium]|nr:16S rRNA (cytosine(1402)-N(4))-methyltransferase RsmH [Desulfovibrionaceae bacterium]